MNNILLCIFFILTPILILILTHFIKDGLKYCITFLTLSASYCNVVLKVVYYVKDQNVQALTSCMIIGAMIVPCWIVLIALKKLLSK